MVQDSGGGYEALIAPRWLVAISGLMESPWRNDGLMVILLVVYGDLNCVIIVCGLMGFNGNLRRMGCNEDLMRNESDLSVFDGS